MDIVHTHASKTQKAANKRDQCDGQLRLQDAMLALTYRQLAKLHVREVDPERIVLDCQ